MELILKLKNLSGKNNKNERQIILMKSLKIGYTNLYSMPKRPKANPIEHYKKQIINQENVIKKFESTLVGWVRVSSKRKLNII